ncbi:Gfo/Idh/MocA family protein [Salirhabdus sp. Marseille-P4669]|uniref:Gfo/Idh/MocA family protein n=1 Tax=Salirhabdus sp. Marseille-P4669 TaxID=2042310 RepID=UPI000C79DBAA|nr:Gfo/Idh/MocA family oxidoreductase [Salirhabdus sp. Marseille-P4669]
MLTIGLVGFGFIGKAHFEAYRAIPDVEVAAICTTKEISVDNYNGMLLTDFDALIQDKNMDIIDLCLPTYLHEEYILKAAKAGKHIICEKPLTLTEESANRIIDAAQRQHVRLFVGHVLRFWPEYQAIKGALEKFPQVDIVTAKRLGQVPSWSAWFQHPNKSGGALFDLHIHDIDFAYDLLGDVAFIYAVGKQNHYGAWDHVMTTLTFANGTVAHMEASHRMPKGYPFTMSFRAQGKNATLDFEIQAGENIEAVDTRSTRFQLYKNDHQTTVEVPPGEAFQNELTYFLDCIRHGEENHVVPLDDVLYVMKLLKAIEQSLETGEKVWVNGQ